MEKIIYSGGNLPVSVPYPRPSILPLARFSRVENTAPFYGRFRRQVEIAGYGEPKSLFVEFRSPASHFVFHFSFSYPLSSLLLVSA